MTGTHPAVRDTFVAWTSQFEGRIRWMYLDAKSIVTAGIGIALRTPADARALPWRVSDSGLDIAASADEIDGAWEVVRSHVELAGIGGAQPVWQRLTDVRLPLSSLDGITLTRFDANDNHMPGVFPRWAEFPADAQLAVHSMVYAMGFGNLLDEFPKFLSAMRALDFATAAGECHMSETGNAPLRPRNVADRELLEHAADVVARGLPRGQLWQAPESA